MPCSERSSEQCLHLTVLPCLCRPGAGQKRKSCSPLQHPFTGSDLPTNALAPRHFQGVDLCFYVATYNAPAVLYFKAARQVVERTVLYYLYQ